jgi:hypothetical protein
MARIALPFALLLAACGQQLPPAASADEIQRAVDRAEMAAASAVAKSQTTRGG